jgi:hypothetical protein
LLKENFMNLSATEKLFPLGKIIITDRAYECLERADIAVAMRRHAHGDWGEIKPDDMEQNDLAVREGGTLTSAYSDRRDRRFVIVTEADRSVTAVMVPDDY